jgi:hypothetical protein
MYKKHDIVCKHCIVELGVNPNQMECKWTRLIDWECWAGKTNRRDPKVYSEGGCICCGKNHPDTAVLSMEQLRDIESA